MRASPRQQQVVQELRERIVSGEFASGEVLPQRMELAARFDVSGVTIQRAVDQLVDEGHVYAVPGTGTFVAPYPPHAHRYGIVLPYERVPAEWQRRAGWSHFWSAISYCAEHFPPDGKTRMTIYYGISGHSDVPDHDRLQSDIKSCRLAGLFLLTLRHNINSPDMIRVPFISLIGQSPAIVLDLVSFFKRALDALRKRGRKRPAVLLPHNFRLAGASLEELFAQSGFELPPWRKQYAWAWSDMENIRNAVHLLLRGAPSERPDSLIIADDHLVTYATIGILSAGLAVPSDLDVVACANFPLPTLSHVPALRLGFDARAMLNAAVSMANDMRAGKSPSHDTRIPAIEESECQYAGAREAMFDHIGHKDNGIEKAIVCAAGGGGGAL